MTKPTTTKQFTTQADGLFFIQLSKIAKDMKLPVVEVFEAFIRFNHENKLLRAFMMVTHSILEIDTWADEGNHKTKRAALEKYYGNIHYEVPTEIHSGYLEVSLMHVNSLLKQNSTEINILWQDMVNYVALAPSIKINRSDIYIATDDIPTLRAKITESYEGLISPKLVNKIRTDFEGSAQNLLEKLTTLESENKELNKVIYYYKDQSAKEKSSAQKLLIAGLIETLLQATKSTSLSPYQKDDGNIKVTELENVVINNLKTDHNISNTSNFRNLMPSLWNKYAKKSIKSS